MRPDPLPDPICFDCWLAEDDESFEPKHLAADGEPIRVNGRENVPLRCAWCEQRWLLVREEGSGARRYLACSRGDAGVIQALASCEPAATSLPAATPAFGAFTPKQRASLP